VSVVFHKLHGRTAAASDAGVRVAFTGSVLAQIVAVRQAMAARLAVAVPGARVDGAAVDPLDGALWLARHR
jgi:hypothetical protein